MYLIFQGDTDLLYSYAVCLLNKTVIAIDFNMPGDTFSMSAQCLCFSCHPAQRGNPSPLKILFVYWHWWEAGNWVERRNMEQNKLHFQPRRVYTTSALAASSSSLTRPFPRYFTRSRAHHFPFYFTFIFTSSALPPPSLVATVCLIPLLSSSAISCCCTLTSPWFQFSASLSCSFTSASLLSRPFLPRLYLGCWTSSSGAY